jgi:GNAT superfamily N-acetyltransferase
MPIPLSDLELVTLLPDTKEELATFDCSDEDLNDFVRNDCFKYQDQCLSHTRLARLKADGRIVGFVTLLCDSIVLKTPEKKRLFSFHHTIVQFPALKIGRLGVHRDLQKGGVGTALLMYSIGVAARLNEELKIGCRFITVDAYAKSVPWYQRNGFLFNKEYTKPTRTHPSMRFDLVGDAQPGA